MQVHRKLKNCLKYCNTIEVPVNSLALVGGAANNKELQEHMRQAIIWGQSDGLPVVTAPAHLNRANGASVAWMGHELCRAEQDVDVRDLKIDSHRRIPLGSFTTDLISK